MLFLFAGEAIVVATQLVAHQEPEGQVTGHYASALIKIWPRPCILTWLMKSEVAGFLNEQAWLLCS